MQQLGARCCNDTQGDLMTFAGEADGAYYYCRSGLHVRFGAASNFFQSADSKRGFLDVPQCGLWIELVI